MKFKPEDFDLQIKLSMTSDILNKKAAEMANVKLKEWLDAAPIMMCRKDNDLWACDEHHGFARITHIGRLVCIEEINNGS